MENIEYPYVRGSIEPVTEADSQGVFQAVTTVGRLNLIVQDDQTIVATDYWQCDCGKTLSRKRTKECPDCFCEHSEEPDALIEDVVDFLKPI